MLRIAFLALCLAADVAHAADIVYGHYMFRGIKATPTAPSASSVLGSKKMANLCTELEAADIFLCHYSWRDGAAGKRMATATKYTDEQLLQVIGSHADVPGVKFVQSKDEYLVNSMGIYDGRVYGKGDPTYTFEGRSRRRLLDASLVQPNAPTVLTYLNPYSPANEYRFWSTGKNVTVYLVDQRVIVDHPEFVGKRIRTYTSFSSNITQTAVCSAEHGTHLAALIAGHTHGVAKEAELVSVAVTAGCGADSRVSELSGGLDWILEDIALNTHGRKVVVAISMLVKDSEAANIIEDQVAELIDMGAVVVAAAGDASDDACLYAPARMAGVITVAAATMETRTSGVPWEGANYGRCLSVWAPGARVESASATVNVTAVFSGSSPSMAITTGIIAQLLESRSTQSVMDDVIKDSSNRVMRWRTPDSVPFFAQVPIPEGVQLCPPVYGS